ncbi:hypothetical protein T484DRAFT_1758017 [Baffinella frigidus]|nr:hypothetical protein T484DRAFT_1758017 [Cryptophyta sp. CCMP2293]
MSAAYKIFKAERDAKEAANPELRAKRLADQRAYSVKIKDARKATESTEQRTDRLAKKSAYDIERRTTIYTTESAEQRTSRIATETARTMESRNAKQATESTEQREDRMEKRNAVNATKREVRDATESEEQRAERRAKHCVYTANQRATRDAAESNEQRADRHAKENHQRYGHHTVEEHAAWLAKKSESDRKRKAEQTDDQRDERRAKRNAYHHRLMRDSPIYKLKIHLRDRLHGAVKAAKCRKTANTEKLLGCSWEHALKHLHNNPRGLKICEGIHVDHIKPFAAFKNLQSPIEQRLVNNWRNLQLLTAEENLQKGSSHDHAAWSVSEAGIKLLAFERELRAAAVDNDDDE